MSAGAKVLLILVGGGIVLGAATVVAGATVVYGSGTIAVDVHENHGGTVSVNIPAGLANLALTLVPDSVVEKAIHEVSVELEPYLPALHEAWSEFERAPDFVLVEVHDGREHVRVEKKNRKLIVLIGGSGEDIRIEVPLKTLRKIVRKL